MENVKYKRLLTHVIYKVRQPGDPLAIVDYFISDTKSIECGLCGWPRTSEKAKKNGLKGLKYVYVLKNLNSGKKLYVGSDCIKIYEQFINDVEPGFTIQIKPTGVTIFDDEEHYEQAELEEYNNKENDSLINELYSEETYHEFFGNDDHEDVKYKDDPQRYSVDGEYLDAYYNDEYYEDDKDPY